MVVSSLSQRAFSGHHDNWLSVLQRRQDRTHSGVGNDQLCGLTHVCELAWFECVYSTHIGRSKLCLSDLRQHLHFRMVHGPCINCGNQTIKRHLGSNGHEDQMTAPRNVGPSGRARCSHCVNHRSAYGRTFSPDIDICSMFAMLSSQIVLAPINLPARIAATPGAAPVVITMSGRSFTTIHNTSRTIRAKSNLLQRVASVTV